MFCKKSDSLNTMCSNFYSMKTATQNIEDFKSKSFDFYANAQYPLIMKQQSISDSVLKDLFGVSGKEFLDLRTEIRPK